MKCTNCKSFINYHDIKENGFYYCIKCGNNFQSEDMDFETESDMSITSNGTIRLRKKFVNPT